MLIEKDSIDDLLKSIYEYILKNGNKNIATKGANKEVLGCELILKNPISRVSHSDSRGVLFSCLGELLWYLSGSNQSDSIEYYISGYSKYKELDGKIHGAYGKRFFKKHNNVNQIDRVINLLKIKPTTRKAVIQLFDSSDLFEEYRDTPCTLDLQFTIRNNRLDMYTIMRSNDAFKGLPHDIFCFTMIQEFIARELRYELGTYHHYVVSLHIYDDDILNVKKYINEGYMLSKSIMTEMPKESWSISLAIIKKYEKKIRNGENVKLNILKLEPYWMDILKLLVFYNKTKEYNIKNFKEALEIKRNLSNKEYIYLINRRYRNKNDI